MSADTSTPVRLLLVDDHEVVREGLKVLLARYVGKVRVVAEAEDAAGAHAQVAAFDPDVVLTDVRLRGERSGLDLCRELTGAEPDRAVVLLSAYDDEQYLFQALRAGARGYLLKWIDGADLVRFVLSAHAGETVIDPAMAARAATSAARLQSGEFWPGARMGLTQRESEVLSLLVSGKSNKTIAAELVIGDETVKTHVSSVFRKLSVRDRASAVAVALREGIVQ